MYSERTMAQIDAILRPAVEENAARDYWANGAGSEPITWEQS